MNYNDEINSIASDIITELKQGGYDPTDIYSAVPEVVDGHEYMIYTSYHKEILANTGNYEAYKDVYCNEDMGAIVAEKGIEGAEQTMAFFALAQDVSEALSTFKDELKEEIVMIQSRRDVVLESIEWFEGQDDLNAHQTTCLSELEQERDEKTEQIELLETIIEGL